MLPGSTLLALTAVSMSAAVMPAWAVFSFMGVIRMVCCGTPVISAMAISGSCSRRRRMMFSAASAISMNFESSESIPFRVICR